MCLAFVCTVTLGAVLARVGSRTRLMEIRSWIWKSEAGFGNPKVGLEIRTWIWKSEAGFVILDSAVLGGVVARGPESG